MNLNGSRLHPGDAAGLSVYGLKARPLRSSLTAVAIAIGIAVMVAVMTIAQSSQARLIADIDRLGTNLLRVTPGQTLAGDAARLPESSVPMIGRIGAVETVSAVTRVEAPVLRTDYTPEWRTRAIRVTAVDLNLLQTLSGSVARGRFLDAAAEKLPTVVLGASAAQRLAIPRPGPRVVIGNHWFAVIGVLEPLGLAEELDGAALIGYSVAREIFGTARSPTTIYVRASVEAVPAVRELLGRTANPHNPFETQVTRPSEALEARVAAVANSAALLVGLGAVALLVGGIGIMNVMLMAVLERRTEIGLRRALGATRRHIAAQFLAEAAVLALLGGVMGLVAGVAGGLGFALLHEWSAIIPWVAIAASVCGALVVGCLAGLYPAWRATRVSPTEALRSA